MTTVLYIISWAHAVPNNTRTDETNVFFLIKRLFILNKEHYREMASTELSKMRPDLRRQ
jgi:hypothetical protein